jgi:hypothetical protein
VTKCAARSERQEHERDIGNQDQDEHLQNAPAMTWLEPKTMGKAVRWTSPYNRGVRRFSSL